VVARSESALDRANITLVLILEEHFATAWTRTPFTAPSAKPPSGAASSGEGADKLLRRSKLPIPCTFDMYTTEATGFLPVSPADRHASASSTSGTRHASDDAVADLEARAHCRYAAGNVLPKPYLAAMFSMAYYTPGVLELVEALVNPAKYAQASLVWSLPPPKGSVGMLYAHLARQLLEEGAVPLGLLRHGLPSNGSNGSHGSNGHGNGATDTPAGPQQHNPTVVLPYVVTALPDDASLVVGPHDAVFVLGDRAWARSHCLLVAPPPPRGSPPPADKKTVGAASGGGGGDDDDDNHDDDDNDDNDDDDAGRASYGSGGKGGPKSGAVTGVTTSTLHARRAAVQVAHKVDDTSRGAGQQQPAWAPSTGARVGRGGRGSGGSASSLAAETETAQLAALQSAGRGRGATNVATSAATNVATSAAASAAGSAGVPVGPRGFTSPGPMRPLSPHSRDLSPVGEGSHYEL
jgi:hypothetical protein